MPDCSGLSRCLPVVGPAPIFTFDGTSGALGSSPPRCGMAAGMAWSSTGCPASSSTFAFGPYLTFAAGRHHVEIDFATMMGAPSVRIALTEAGAVVGSPMTVTPPPAGATYRFDFTTDDTACGATPHPFELSVDVTAAATDVVELREERWYNDP